jgi:uncharacterized protein YndB with AHSA1/START domain
MKTIIHGVILHAPPERIYEALTTAAGLSAWWTTKVDAEAREGGIIRFTFADPFNPQMKQSALRPGQAVEWKCVGGHDPWRDNTFTFLLDRRGADTFLRFTQHYAQELSDEQYGIYNFNWGYYLNSLKLFCETGSGMPFVPSP